MSTQVKLSCQGLFSGDRGWWGGGHPHTILRDTTCGPPMGPTGTAASSTLVMAPKLSLDLGTTPFAEKGHMAWKSFTQSWTRSLVLFSFEEDRPLTKEQLSRKGTSPRTGCAGHSPGAGVVVERSPEPLPGLISTSPTAENHSSKVKSIFTEVVVPVGERQFWFLVFKT